MDQDTWRITLSGDSITGTYEGIPEGNKYGPAAFNLLPDGLVKDLLRSACGISFSAQVPAVWAGHHWTGKGFPDQSLVLDIVSRLKEGRQLPDRDLITTDCHVEASCARALDLVADLRDPCAFSCR